MRGAVIGKVIATKSSQFSIGEYVNATSGWAELAIMKEKDLQKIEVPANGKVTDGLGVLGTYPINMYPSMRRHQHWMLQVTYFVLSDIALTGLTGLTAYFGLLDVGKVKAGDFVVVSGAAGKPSDQEQVLFFGWDMAGMSHWIVHD